MKKKTANKPTKKATPKKSLTIKVNASFDQLINVMALAKKNK